jgi:hypothetical protein
MTLLEILGCIALAVYIASTFVAMAIMGWTAWKS